MTDYKELCERLMDTGVEDLHGYAAVKVGQLLGEAAEALEAAEMHKAAAPLCEKHAPNGGARSGCLVCSGMKLSAALSRIDYLCGEPNDMECSGYDIHFNEDAVVENVRKLQALVAAWEQVWDNVRLDLPNLREDNKPLAVAATYGLLRQECDALRSRAEAAEKAIKEHNDGCVAACEARQRGDYGQDCSAWISRKRRCLDCARDSMIDYPAAIAAGGDDAKD